MLARVTRQDRQYRPRETIRQGFWQPATAAISYESLPYSKSASCTRCSDAVTCGFLCGGNFVQYACMHAICRQHLHLLPDLVLCIQSRPYRTLDIVSARSTSQAWTAIPKVTDSRPHFHSSLCHGLVLQPPCCLGC